MRPLSRAPAAPRRELNAATVRLKAGWLRHARRATGRATWRPAHRRGRRAGAVPPRRRPASCTKTSEPSTNPPHGSTGGSRHATRRSPPGGGRRPSPPARPCGGARPRGGHHAGRTRRAPARRDAPPADAGLGPPAVRLGRGRATPAGGAHHRRAHPGAAGSGGRRWGFAVSRPRESTAATAAGHPTPSPPRHQREGPRALGSTRSTTASPRPTRQPRGGGHGP